MRHLKKFNEEIGNPKFLNFVNKLNMLFDDEYEEGDEPSNTDLLSEIGDLCNEFDMSSSDIEEVIKNYSLDFTKKNLLSSLLDETKESESKQNTKTEPCEKEAKDFAEWLRHTCVISSDEGYYYEDGETYDINGIYNIYKNR